MSVLENAQQLHKMMAEGQTMEAFEKFYHEDVTITEMPNGEQRNGKNAQREAIQGWFESVQEFHGGGVDSICADEENGITTAETWTEITFKGGGKVKMSEVAVQKWKDGQIIDEKFYYHMPGQN